MRGERTTRTTGGERGPSILSAALAVFEITSPAIECWEARDGSHLSCLSPWRVFPKGFPSFQGRRPAGDVVQQKSIGARVGRGADGMRRQCGKHKEAVLMPAARYRLSCPSPLDLWHLRTRAGHCGVAGAAVLHATEVCRCRQGQGRDGRPGNQGLGPLRHHLFALRP